MYNTTALYIWIYSSKGTVICIVYDKLNNKFSQFNEQYFAVERMIQCIILPFEVEHFYVLFSSA